MNRAQKVYEIDPWTAIKICSCIFSFFMSTSFSDVFSSYFSSTSICFGQKLESLWTKRSGKRLEPQISDSEKMIHPGIMILLIAPGSFHYQEFTMEASISGLEQCVSNLFSWKIFFEYFLSSYNFLTCEFCCLSILIIDKIYLCDGI